MDLNDYFHPVSLKKPLMQIVPEKLTFSRAIKIHTPDLPINEIYKFEIAIIGVPEDLNAFVKGSAKAPDIIRSKLYQLSALNRKLPIIDLGNLKITGKIEDTYYALRDIVTELRNNNVLPVIIGGSQDLTYGINMAFEKLNKRFTLGTVDARIDFGFKEKQITSANYLDHILEKKNHSLYYYFNIGHQAYFSHYKIIGQLEKKGYDCIRLGSARSDLSALEPYFRDAGFISIDMGCVRHSDAPGVTIPSSNGFFGHELCQITKYAGTSSSIQGIGFFETAPGNDINEHTSHLVAQAIWYFFEGYSLKLNEQPDQTGNKKFIINISDLPNDLVFYKSNRSERWWMEMPFTCTDTGKNVFISCTYNDYQQACNREIPDRWWKAYTRLS